MIIPSSIASALAGLLANTAAGGLMQLDPKTQSKVMVGPAGDKWNCNANPGGSSAANTRMTLRAINQNIEVLQNKQGNQDWATTCFIAPKKRERISCAGDAAVWVENNDVKVGIDYGNLEIPCATMGNIIDWLKHKCAGQGGVYDSTGKDAEAIKQADMWYGRDGWTVRMQYEDCDKEPKS